MEYHSHVSHYMELKAEFFLLREFLLHEAVSTDPFSKALMKPNNQVTINILALQKGWSLLD